MLPLFRLPLKRHGPVTDVQAVELVVVGVAPQLAAALPRLAVRGVVFS